MPEGTIVLPPVIVAEFEITLKLVIITATKGPLYGVIVQRRQREMPTILSPPVQISSSSAPPAASALVPTRPRINSPWPETPNLQAMWELVRTIRLACYMSQGLASYGSIELIISMPG